ncbi:aldo/keto reductase [Roseovarius indicus]|uniref:General stress protein 69 n=2 Tax=Roseovarius indicus TaxID=540747 RepID=A0A5P3AD10_9RHOB|nr:aldo/keto reductase [Roseovarius indicus]QEW27091.1 General stress protein 69 [Roseovarius indicus]SFD54341.1 Aldo/keto reductase [Roseovarius indicus]
MPITRRNMLTGAAAAFALPSVPALADTAPLRTIPSTGARVPAVGLGSWITFNVGTDPVLLDACAEVIAAFVDEGGGMIDSSPMYGSSQATIGYGLEKLNDTNTVFPTDKVWTNNADMGPEQIAQSRAAWGIGRFDLLQVHNLVAWEAHLETLFAMKEEGRLSHVGLTTSHGRRHDLLERLMRDHPVDTVQLTYNLADREAEDRLLPLAREKGIAVIANRPYRRGTLPQRLQGQPLPDVARDLEVDTWPQLLLKFILSHPALTVAIPATTQVAHVRENKAAARGPMPDAEMRRRIVAHFQTL